MTPPAPKQLPSFLIHRSSVSTFPNLHKLLAEPPLLHHHHHYHHNLYLTPQPCLLIDGDSVLDFCCTSRTIVLLCAFIPLACFPLLSSLKKHILSLTVPSDPNSLSQTQIQTRFVVDLVLSVRVCVHSRICVTEGFCKWARGIKH